MAESPFRRLISGIDTVSAAYYLAPQSGPFSFDQLLAQKEALRAAKSRDGLAVEIAGKELLLTSHGSQSGYPLLLKNAELAIECGPLNTPSFFVTFRSGALWRRGSRTLHQEFLDWAARAALTPLRAESLSRVDFAFDYHLPCMDFGKDCVVSLSSKDAEYREDRTPQTLTFGKSEVVLRIYNKTMEIIQQSPDKVWLFELWGTVADVWRIEWQVRKDVLRRFGIHTFQDLADGYGDVLRYLATEHDTLRSPTSDTNRSRWPLHPLWTDVIGHIDSFSAQGVYREVDEQAALNERPAHRNQHVWQPKAHCGDYRLATWRSLHLLQRCRETTRDAARAGA
jgi:hypothetical protein